MRVAGGAIAKKVLSSLGVKVRGGVVQVGDIKPKILITKQKMSSIF